MNAFQVVSTGINVALLLVAIQVTRHMSRIEFKVDMMWDFFRDELKESDKAHILQKMRGR